MVPWDSGLVFGIGSIPPVIHFWKEYFTPMHQYYRRLVSVLEKLFGLKVHTLLDLQK